MIKSYNKKLNTKEIAAIMLFCLVYIFSLITGYQVYLLAIMFTILVAIFVFKYINFNNFIFIFIPLTVLSPSLNLISGAPAIRLDDLWLVIGIMFLIMKKQLIFRFDHIKLPVIILLSFIIWIFLTVILSLYREPHLFQISDFFEPLKLTKLLLIFILINNLKYNLRNIGRMIYVLVISISVSAFFGVLQFYNFIGINEWLSPIFIGQTNIQGFYDNARVVGTFGNPNIFAGALLVGLSFLISKLFNKFSFSALLLFILNVYSLILTQSRTGLVVFFIIASLVIIYQFKFINFTKYEILSKFSLLFITPISILVVLRVLPDNVFRRIDGLNNISEDLSFNTRLYVWETTFENRTLDNLILGTGPTGKLRIIFDNEWLHILTHYGLIGLVLLSALLILFYHSSKTENSWISIANKVMILGLCIYMVTASVFHTLQLAPLVITAFSLTYLLNNSKKV